MAHSMDESIAPHFWENLVGAWAPCLGYQRFNVWDRSLHKNDGTFNGAIGDWVFDGGTYGLDFDNVDDKLDIGTLSDANKLIENNTPFTVSWWENVHSGSTGFPDRCALQIASPSPTANRKFSIVRNDNSSYATIAWGGSFTGPASLRASGAPTLTNGVGVWIHWTLSAFDGSVSTAASYVLCADGTDYAVTSGGAYSSGNNDQNQWGDTNINAAGNCILDDMLIWKHRALNVSEINELHKLGRGGIYIPRWADTRAIMAL